MVLATPLIGYLLSPILRGERGQYKRWITLGELDEFPEGQTGLASFKTPSPVSRMVTPTTFLAGCAAFKAISSRFSPSTVPTWDVRCAGSHNLAFSCAPAMAACTTRMDRGLPVRRRADSSSISTELKTATC